MKCPKCDSSLSNKATSCICGWTVETEKPAADYARIAAERQASVAKGYAPAPRKIACQSTLCPPTSRALPDRDLCRECAAIEDSGGYVPRIRRPHWIKGIGQVVEGA